MTAPLTPAACDLRGMPFMPLDVVRLLDSDLFALTTGDEFKAAVALWCKSWNQVPAASIPCDDRIICRLAGLSLKEWAAVKAAALRQWVLCDDGRLYHPVVAEKALEAWTERQAHQEEREHENDRKRREREDRKRMFAELRTAGLVAPWNIKTADLRKLHAERVTTDAPVTRTVTSVDGPGHGDGHAQVTAKTGTGTGTGIGKKSSDADASAHDGDDRDPDAEAWSLAVSLLTKRAQLSDRQARTFFAGLLKRHSLRASEIYVALAHAEDAGTPDLQPYLTAAAQTAQRTRNDRPGPDRNRTASDDRSATRSAIYAQLAAEEDAARAGRA